MHRHWLPLMTRSIPQILFKSSLISISLYGLSQNNSFKLPMQSPVRCVSFKEQMEVDPINNLLVQVFKIGVHGDTIGYAFCIEEGVLVTASPAIMEKGKNLEFYLQDQNIEADYSILGQYENLTFFRIKNSKAKFSPMPAIKSTDRLPITPVQVVQKRSFLSINDGYIVTKSSGFGIVDGKGEVGSLVIANGKAAGVVTHIGRDSEKGFMRMATWPDLPNLLKRLVQKKELYLGVSAAAMEERDGLAIARVSTDSPFHDKLMMGDIIVRVNSQSIRQAEDLKRIVMLSQNSVTVKIQREGKILDIQVPI